jgi:hypothetical protein
MTLRQRFTMFTPVRIPIRFGEVRSRFLKVLPVASVILLEERPLVFAVRRQRMQHDTLALRVNRITKRAQYDGAVAFQIGDVAFCAHSVQVSVGC